MPRLIGSNGFLPEYCNADSLNRVTSHVDFGKTILGSLDLNKFFIVQVGHWINQSKKSFAEMSPDQFQFVGGCPQTHAENSHKPLLNILAQNLENIFWIFECIEDSGGALENPCFRFAKIELNMFLSDSMKSWGLHFGKTQDVPILVFRKEDFSKDISFAGPQKSFFVLPAKDYIFERVLSPISQKWSVHMLIPNNNVLQTFLDVKESPSASFRKLDHSQWSHNLSNDIWLQKKSRKIVESLAFKHYKLSPLSVKLLDNAQMENCIMDYLMPHSAVQSADNSTSLTMDDFEMSFDEPMVAHKLKETPTETPKEIQDFTNETTELKDLVPESKDLSSKDLVLEKKDLSSKDWVPESTRFENHVFVSVPNPWTLSSFLRQSLCVFP